MWHLALALVAFLFSFQDASADFRGALVHSRQGFQQSVEDSFNEAKWKRVEFPVVAYDTSNLWDSANNQFVVPEGVNFVRLQGQIVWSHSSVGARQVLITKNNQLFDGYAAHNNNATRGTTPDQNISTPILPVKTGDTFQLQAWHFNSENGPPTYIYDNGGTWFSIEIIDD